MMVLRDGPAKGAYIVGRAPFLLRAVVDRESGHTNVLDQLSDTPEPSERIHVYRCVKWEGGIAMVMLSGKNGRGRHCVQSVIAEYVHVPDVDGEPFRDTAAWQEWAVANANPGDIDPRTNEPIGEMPDDVEH